MPRTARKKKKRQPNYRLTLLYPSNYRRPEKDFKGNLGQFQYRDGKFGFASMMQGQVTDARRCRTKNAKRARSAIRVSFIFRSLTQPFNRKNNEVRADAGLHVGYLSQGGAEEGEHEVAGNVGEGGDFEGVMAAMEFEGAR
jgi:hypothetical protein